MGVVVLLLLGLPVFLILLLPKLRKNGGKVHPPGPPGLPFIGNLHQLDTSALHLNLWQLSKKYGPLMSMRLGSVPTLVVSSAKMAKEVMKTHDLAFSNRPALLGQQKLSYNGLDIAFSPCNDYWRDMRKLCTLHLFSSKRLQSFRPIREDEVAQMVKKISVLSTSSKLANLNEIATALTLNSTCRVAFSKRYDDEGYESHRFHSLLREIQGLWATFFVSDYFPMVGWLDKFTGSCARLERQFKNMDLFYQDLIDEHLDPKRSNSTGEDFVDILLRLRKDGLSSFNLTLDHIKALLMDVLVGGTDALSATVVWTMTELIKNPVVMKKVQEEVRALVGEKGRVDEDDLQELLYLKAVIKEAMRLHPPAPLLIPRETMDRCVIEGYEIQPKTLVYVNVWAIGRDPESWETPEEFSPERFLDSTIDYKGQDFEFLPFGGGRRGCPGISMGAATVELALANLLYSLDWELPSGMKKEDVDSDTTQGLAMHKKNALCLVPIIYTGDD
ncbi:hypothetical protein RJ640_020885 [Escallonia rubra]|uniref:Cytochrome P450 71A1 n=1 Tax=Escallonia rubra TaxID=112253 RepID=A0AA88QIU0_9ASTE|nr:hypothetical protein RJ640_020885 [Escallonia rubra]